MNAKSATTYFVRARDIQMGLFQRRQKAWAKALGAKLATLKQDFPHLQSL